MTVSWRRSAVPSVREGGGDGGTGPDLIAVSDDPAESLCPHSAQNLAFDRTAVPQDGQRIDSAAPHSGQNLLPSATSEWQLGHSMSAPQANQTHVLFQTHLETARSALEQARERDAKS
jgi:hypothetical protein